MRCIHKSKLIKQLLVIIGDICLAGLSLSISYLLGPNAGLKSLGIADYLTFVSSVVAVRIGTFYLLGLYRWPWRYASTNEMLMIIYAVSAGSAAVAILTIVSGYVHNPLNLLLMDWSLLVVFMWANRFSVRIFKGFLSPSPRCKKVIVIGAGDAGEMLVRQMIQRKGSPYLPVGFVDDDRTKLGRSIHRIRVLGTTEDLTSIAKRYGLEKALIAIPSADAAAIQRIVSRCHQAGLNFKLVPGTLDIIKGESRIDSLRQLRPQDLLGRQTVEIDSDQIFKLVRSQSILVTGAAGSIGSELCRQIMQFDPEKLIMLDNSEEHLYYLGREFSLLYSREQFVSVVADIRDKARLTALFKTYKPSIIFHAAAYKHVPLMEDNESECLKTNVLGTENVLHSALDSRCHEFVLISTDKAVRPTSVMGTSKKVAELLVQANTFNPETKLSIVRFGNVLGSRGSVVPLFMKQIEAGGPVTVTHPDVVRYFMTITEACQLILQAATMGNGGEIFVLDMGKPIKILDLAKNLIALSGYEPDKDIEIKFIGLRPGEKMFEEIARDEKGIQRTRHEKVFVVPPEKVEAKAFLSQLDRLKAIINSEGMSESIRSVLKGIVPSYCPAINNHEKR